MWKIALELKVNKVQVFKWVSNKFNCHSSCFHFKKLPILSKMTNLIINSFKTQLWRRREERWQSHSEVISMATESSAQNKKKRPATFAKRLLSGLICVVSSLFPRFINALNHVFFNQFDQKRICFQSNKTSPNTHTHAKQSTHTS